MTEQALAAYVHARFGADARIERFEELGKDGGEKAFGYGRVFRVTLTGANTSEIVIHLARRGGFGHDTLADRAAEALLAYETFNALPAHVHALDVGTVDGHGHLASLGDVRDFFLVTAYGRGEPYFLDLERIAKTGVATDEDRARCERLAEHLAKIHGTRKDAPELYLRRLRDLVGHHECMAGLIDSYDGHAEEGIPPRPFFRHIEHWAIEERHRQKAFTHRLRRVHGDYHPWNVLFEGEGFARRLVLLDRSRGEWGEAADDLAAMAINYVFFAARAGQGASGPLADLFRRFFATYIGSTGDREVLDVIAPYFVWRALVVASPVWYPRLDPDVRGHMFSIMQKVMHHPRFDVESVQWLFDR
ncbi:MAG: phosphotransferase family protein [Polyangiales bacterium]